MGDCQCLLFQAPTGPVFGVVLAGHYLDHEALHGTAPASAGTAVHKPPGGERPAAMSCYKEWLVDVGEGDIVTTGPNAGWRLSMLKVPMQ